MKRVIAISVLSGLALLLMPAAAAAHCEIPCGIYDDHARIHLIEEHIRTIEKSMKNVIELEKMSPKNRNQLVRWVMNKEEHATKIQHIVSQYFLTQRIKPDMKDYDKILPVLHQMLIEAMKAKQTTDIAHTEALRGLLMRFEKLYEK